MMTIKVYRVAQDGTRRVIREERELGVAEVTRQCALCGSGERLRVVAVRGGMDVLACPTHAPGLAAPLDDNLSALAWYQSKRRAHLKEAQMNSMTADGGKHGGEPSDKPWAPPPAPPSPDGFGPSKQCDGS
ncbi:hypothetical protein [Streptomyces ficellus]|uniref:Uncharacterized protein n=1 Tax=Streptomyces ficellus TaxID=1977088 RepID=A0A6I6FCG0_9ACTN|nr:hypothetical protein [Streptomyces ficellus]QGV78587.1 hypothetical protein EIZ62_10285 [Streptomyces ficellus]